MILFSPEVGTILFSPEVGTILFSPKVGTILFSPEVGTILFLPEVGKILLQVVYLLKSNSISKALKRNAPKKLESLLKLVSIFRILDY
jgi:hypothetical protein